METLGLKALGLDSDWGQDLNWGFLVAFWTLLEMG